MANPERCAQEPVRRGNPKPPIGTVSVRSLKLAISGRPFAMAACTARLALQHVGGTELRFTNPRAHRLATGTALEAARRGAALPCARPCTAALKGEATLTELAERFHVHANQTTQWTTQLVTRYPACPESFSAPGGRGSSAKARVRGSVTTASRAFAECSLLQLQARMQRQVRGAAIATSSQRRGRPRCTCRTQERRRIAVKAYTSAHCTSLRTDTNSFGPCETERSPGPYAIAGTPSAA